MVMHFAATSKQSATEPSAIEELEKYFPTLYREKN